MSGYLERSEVSTSSVRRGIRFLEAYSVAVLYVLVNAILRALRVLMWPRRRPSDPARICIYRNGFIGDTVVALPAMNAIRNAYPRAHITLLTSPVQGKFPGAKELLAGSPLFDEIHVYLKSEVTGFRNRVTFLRAMRGRRFDMWIDLPQELSGPFNHLRNMLIARFAGAGWGYGWGFVTTIKFWVQAQAEVLRFESEVEKLLGIVRRAGIATADKIEFPISLGPEERKSVDDLVRTRSGRLIAIAPGAKRSLSLWPAGRFVAVGRYLVARNFEVVVLGGSADASVCRVVAEGVGGRTLNLAGQTSLKESCEVLKRCAMLICNDSGVQHLASAVGTPCISIFSAHDMPGKWHPYGAHNVVLRKWVPCHTCYLQTCPNDNRCLKLIGADDVIEAINTKLGNASENDIVYGADAVLST